VTGLTPGDPPPVWSLPALQIYVETLIAAIRERAAAYEAWHIEITDRLRERAEEQDRIIAGLMTRDQLDAARSVLDERLTAMASRLDRIEGKASGVSTVWAALLAGSGAAAAIVSVVVLLARARGG